MLIYINITLCYSLEDVLLHILDLLQIFDWLSINHFVFCGQSISVMYGQRDNKQVESPSECVAEKVCDVMAIRLD